MALLEQLKALVEPSPGETRVLLPALQDNEGEHELRWSSFQVTWSVGGVQKRKWAFRDPKQPVVAASFAWFDSEPSSSPSMSMSGESLSSSSKPRSSTTFGLFTLMRDMPFKSNDAQRFNSRTFTICIFLRDTGRIYTPDGTEFTINLPFQVRKVWPMQPVGLMLQSLPSYSDDPSLSFSSIPKSATFSLSSPYDELRPVQRLLPSTSYLPTNTSQSTALSPNEDVVFISPSSHSSNSPNPPLVAAVNSSLGTLLIYRYSELSRSEELAHTSSVAAADPAIEESLPTKATSPLRTSGRLAEKRRISQTRNELSMTLDRMAIDGSPGVDTIMEEGWEGGPTTTSSSTRYTLELLFSTALNAPE